MLKRTKSASLFLKNRSTAKASLLHQCAPKLQRYSTLNNFSLSKNQTEALDKEIEELREVYFQNRKEQFMDKNYIPLNAANNKKLVTRFYKTIFKLLVQLNNNKMDRATRIAIEMVKSEFRKNFDMHDQVDIDKQFEACQDYIINIHAKLKSKQYLDAMQTLETAAAPQAAPSTANSKTIDPSGDLETYLEKTGRSLTKYWNHYYQQEGAIEDWYCSWETVQRYLTSLKHDAKTLVLGGGFSSLSQHLLKWSQNVYDIDISTYSIKRKEEEHRESSGLRYLRMDVRDLAFPDDTFDVVVDKAVCDILASEEDTAERDIQLYEEQVWRVLKPEGYLFLASALPLEGVQGIFSSYNWRIEELGKEKFSFDEEPAAVNAALSQLDSTEGKSTDQGDSLSELVQGAAIYFYKIHKSSAPLGEEAEVELKQ